MVAIRAPPPQPRPTYDPNLWYIFGAAYDLTPFLSRHPGGLQPLLISRGRDCTNLLRSYHYLPTCHLLRRLRPYRLPHHCDPHADYPTGPLPDSDFHLALKALVRRYRRHSALSIRAPHLCVVLASVLALAAMLVAHLRAPTWYLALLLPLVAWLPTTIVSHDGSHFATHPHPAVNALSALLCAPFYFNSTVWVLQHVIAHHQYTNDPARDVDMHHGSWLARMSPAQPWFVWMPYSAAPFLLLLQLLCSTLWESIVLPLGLLLDCLCGTARTFPSLPNKNPLVRARLPLMLAQLALTLAVLLAPLVLHRRALSPAQLYLYSLVPFHVSSLVFILATQFAHLTHRSAARTARLHARLAARRHPPGDAFAERQVAASVDVRPACRWLNLLTGGLNTQSLHHLVPGVHNSHFPHLYPEYRRICHHHGVHLCEAHSILAEFARYLTDVMTINLHPAPAPPPPRRTNNPDPPPPPPLLTAHHVARRSDLLVIDNAAYRISDFARRHPGGHRVITTLAGLDATNIFYSTHRATAHRLATTMAPLKVGHIAPSPATHAVPQSTVSAVPRADEFLVELNREVSAVLRDGGAALRAEAVRAGWVRTLTLAAWAAGYGATFFGAGWMGSGGRAVAAAWAGLCACALVGQVAHEETHGVLRWWGGGGSGGGGGGGGGAGARWAWAWAWAVSTLWGALWPSMSEPYFRFEHTTHHVEPLNPEFDYEVTGLSYFVRYHESQTWRVWHQWQQWYAWAVYGVYIVLQTAFEYPLGFFRRFHRRYHSGAWHWYNWSVTALVYGVLPRCGGAVTVRQHAALVLCYAYVWQLMLYLVAAINHAVDGKGAADARRAGVWSYHVLRHTSNFCVGHPFWNWLSGGFNVQNEHHLLSWIPQEHLHRAVPVTKRLCAKYGYPYLEFHSFGALLAAHFRALKAFGKRPHPARSD